MPSWHHSCAIAEQRPPSTSARQRDRSDSSPHISPVEPVDLLDPKGWGCARPFAFSGLMEPLVSRMAEDALCVKLHCLNESAPKGLLLVGARNFGVLASWEPISVSPEKHEECGLTGTRVKSRNTSCEHAEAFPMVVAETEPVLVPDVVLEDRVKP